MFPRIMRSFAATVCLISALGAAAGAHSLSQAGARRPAPRTGTSPDTRAGTGTATGTAPTGTAAGTGTDKGTAARAAANPDAGRGLYQQMCARCHGADGLGGELAPEIVSRAAARSDRELSALIRTGLPAKGMPGATIGAADLRALVAFIRTLKPRRRDAPVPVRVTLSDGSTVQGLAMNRSSADLQLLADDGRLHLLRRDDSPRAGGDAIAGGAATSGGAATGGTTTGGTSASVSGGASRDSVTRDSAGISGIVGIGGVDSATAGERYRRTASHVDWPTYNGDVGGNRYSPLKEIDTDTVKRLAPAWTFSLPGAERLEVTPIVVDGVMYVTSANECYALDAGSGRRIWHFQRPRTKGLAGDAAGNINRGVAIDGDRLFMVTDHAHLIALNRFTGALLWDTEMADWRKNYGATSAPLVAGDLVISGTSGGDEGIRGFVAAYDPVTGKEAWRFWTVPRPGEPGSETWRGKDIEHPCAATWLTGTYDAARRTVYWPTGNPCPDYDGRERLGDNLYSDSILALDVATGKLRWYFQYTPHDLWDWDAQQPPVLIDADWQGQPRQLLLHANRNGFFYVLDRVSGALLLAKPFVKTLTWAREIAPNGRPVMNPGQEPTPEGTKVCPAVEGATNWFSTAFSPSTGLYYVQSLEKCTVYHLTPETWQPGRSYYGGTTKQVAEERGQKVLRAIDVQTGAIRWELPQVGPANSWGGTLATAGGLVFFGEDSGALMAVDATNGTPRWRFQTNTLWKASPMTYAFDGRQHLAVAAGPTIISFALVP